jgi:hypothetical protein
MDGTTNRNYLEPFYFQGSFQAKPEPQIESQNITEEQVDELLKQKLDQSEKLLRICEEDLRYPDHCKHNLVLIIQKLREQIYGTNQVIPEKSKSESVEFNKENVEDLSEESSLSDNDSFSDAIIDEDEKQLESQNCSNNKKALYWSDEEEETLKDLFARGYNVSKIATIMDKTFNSINSKLRALKRKINGEKRKNWTEEEVIKLKELHSEERNCVKIGYRLRRNCESIRGKLVREGLIPYLKKNRTCGNSKREREVTKKFEEKITSQYHSKKQKTSKE